MRDYADETFYERHATVGFIVLLILTLAVFAVPVLQSALASVERAL